MGESLLLITIVTLVILTLRRAKPVVLESPVTIQRPGKYHILLAPQLNRAQTFIENIADQFLSLNPTGGDLPSQYYEIRDPAVFAKGESAYLLAATLRNGLLYFQAINPDSMEKDAASQLKKLNDVSSEVLSKFPTSTPAGEQWAKDLRYAVGTAADQLKIAVKELSA